MVVPEHWTDMKEVERIMVEAALEAGAEVRRLPSTNSAHKG